MESSTWLGEFACRALLRFTPTCFRPAIKLNGASCLHEPIRNEAGPSFSPEKEDSL
jgi:hypothetical protein